MSEKTEKPGVESPEYYAAEAVAYRTAASRAHHRGDRYADRGHDTAAVRSWQEGRRLDALADRYEELARKP